MRAHPMRKISRGFTLIEICLVIAVGFGIMVGGILFYRQAAAGMKVRTYVSHAIDLQRRIPMYANAQQSVSTTGNHWIPSMRSMLNDMMAEDDGWKVISTANQTMAAERDGMLYKINPYNYPGFSNTFTAQADCRKLLGQVKATGIFNDKDWFLTDECWRVNQPRFMLQFTNTKIKADSP